MALFNRFNRSLPLSLSSAHLHFWLRSSCKIFSFHLVHSFSMSNSHRSLFKWFGRKKKKKSNKAQIITFICSLVVAFACFGLAPKCATFFCLFHRLIILLLISIWTTFSFANLSCFGVPFTNSRSGQDMYVLTRFYWFAFNCHLKLVCVFGGQRGKKNKFPPLLKLKCCYLLTYGTFTANQSRHSPHICSIWAMCDGMGMICHCKITICLFSHRAVTV